MHPLTKARSLDATPAELTALLLDKDALSLRNLGRLILSQGITSKNGKVLPTELWLMIHEHLEQMLLGDRKSSEGRWELVVCTDVETSLNAADDGELSKNIITVQPVIFRKYVPDDMKIKNCYDFDNISDIRRCNNRLTFPRDLNMPLIVNETKSYKIKLYDAGIEGDNGLLPHCLYENINLTDIILRLKGGECSFCHSYSVVRVCDFWDDERYSVMWTDVPEDQFDYMVACPVCIGIESMDESREWWTDRSWPPTEDDATEHESMMKAWKEAIGY
ncbi:hypothetical protein ABW21_db0208183 [Orbilia brochopaga]|nr:hypothetical protein ABW21_db0208183 [Drechslerella brochopaga]